MPGHHSFVAASHEVEGQVCQLGQLRLTLTCSTQWCRFDTPCVYLALHYMSLLLRETEPFHHPTRFGTVRTLRFSR